MKTAAFFAVALWFAVSAYAGFRLTERSFAWIREPGFGLVGQKASSEEAVPANGERQSAKLPPFVLEQAKKLTPQQLLCLQASIKPSRIQAALAGEMTAEEKTAVQACLQ